MSSGMAAPAVAPATYNGFRIHELDDRFYGIPTALVRDESNDPLTTLRHPAVVSSRTWKGLRAQIDEFDPTPFLAESLGTVPGYELLRHGGLVYAVPQRLGCVDLNVDAERTQDGILVAATLEQLRDRIAAAERAVPVEFTGWLPVFMNFGNCGTHPQFAHTQEPPPGYRFVRSQPTAGTPRRFAPLGWVSRQVGRACKVVHKVTQSAVSLGRNVREFGVRRVASALGSLTRAAVSMSWKSRSVRPVLRFLRTRHFRSQVMTPRKPELVFITSVPYTYGQNPWVIEIEDPTTLFFPFVENGKTAVLNVRASPYFPIVRALLEADNCRGILTHMRSTAEALPVLFGSEKIARKVSYAPLGVRLPPRPVNQDDDDTVHLLFTNSWHQSSEGFFLRGGLDVLEAFWVLQARYPQVRLTMRSSIPRLEPRHERIIEKGWVRIFDRYLTPVQMDSLQREAHIYLLPSARIHIVSVLQAMSYGQAVVVSDGWGMSEYVEHGRNGLVVPGRGGKVSWMDTDAGVLREDYKPMYDPNPDVIEGLVAAVSQLVEERETRKQLATAARNDVATKFTMTQWNAALKAAFDKARAGNRG